LIEKRERVRKKDQEDLAGAAKGGKAPAKGKDKGGKGAPAKGAAPVEEEETKESVVFPVAQNHVNKEIKDFLEHFASFRMITIPEVSKDPRKRSEEEKSAILDDFENEVKQQESTFT
jgi:hypothetical protein